MINNMWNKLSMKDKAAYIKMAVKNGITDLDTLRDIYNEYAGGGFMEDKKYETNPVYRRYIESKKNRKKPQGKLYGKSKALEDVPKIIDSLAQTAESNIELSNKVRDANIQADKESIAERIDNFYPYKLFMNSVPVALAGYSMGLGAYEKLGHTLSHASKVRQAWADGIGAGLDTSQALVNYGIGDPLGGAWNTGQAVTGVGGVAGDLDLYSKITNPKWKKIGDKVDKVIDKINIVSNGSELFSPFFNNGGYLNTYDDGGYKVQKGDSLWRIAHNNGISLDELMSFNEDRLKGNINTVIHPGDILNIRKPPRVVEHEWVNINDLNEKESSLNRDNVAAIQSVPHDSNYAIINKKDRKLRVYDKNNKLLYETGQINTGLSHDDYNTQTFTDKNGNLLEVGNMSTPAGITAISGVGTYHGVPSFSRARINQDGSIRKIKDSEGNIVSDDVASSMHFGNIAPGKGSNGCVRVGGKQCKELPKYLHTGSMIYTLPEKEGSRFEVRDGKLNFFADNPYGDDTNITNLPNLPEYIERYDKNGNIYQMPTEKYKKFGNDYNLHVDTSYNPLLIEETVNSGIAEDDYEYRGNIMTYANTLMGAKETLQKELGLDSKTYNELARLAMGLAEQETKFGTSKKYKIKNVLTDTDIDYLKWLKSLKKNPENLLATELPHKARSFGYTQIKLEGDNEETQALYKKLGIDRDTLQTPRGAALGTMARLASIYKNEVKGRTFTGKDKKKIDSMDALLYKWMGKGYLLKGNKAIPSNNSYLNSVKKYSSRFNYLSQQEK